MRNLLWEEASTLTSLQFVRVLCGRRMNVNWFHHWTLLVRCGFSVLVGWLMGQFYSANSFWAHLKSPVCEKVDSCVWSSARQILLDWRSGWPPTKSLQNLTSWVTQKSTFLTKSTLKAAVRLKQGSFFYTRSGYLPCELVCLQEVHKPDSLFGAFQVVLLKSWTCAMSLLRVSLL